jgi:hypothetical protein
MDAQAIEQRLSVLGQTPEQLQRRQSQMARLRVIYAALALPAFLALDAYLAVRLLTAWQTHDWSSFWDDMRWGWTLLPLAGGGSVFYELGRQAGQARLVQAATARQLARRDTSTDGQPEPLAGRELVAGAGRIGPLKRIERGRTLDLAKATIVASPLALCAVVGFVLYLIFAHPPTLADLLFVTALFVFFGCPFVVAAMFMLIKLRRVREPLIVGADEWGLDWQPPTIRRKREQLAWHDARSLFAIAEPQVDGNSRNSTYILQGEKRRFAWAAPPHAEAAMLGASERLARLIVTRTRLPLIIISAATLSPEDYDPNTLVPSPVDPPLGKRTARFLTLAWLAPMSLAALIALAGLILSHLPA